jgi:hypothetical protein
MVWWSSRRGQNAASAAILVALIGGLLIAYILFLPPAEREKLLFGSGGGAGGPGGQYGGGGVFTQYGPVLILLETPGTLRMLKSPVVEHNIPSSTIYTAVNTREIKTIDSAVVKNGVFARKDLDISFPADRQGSNYLLSFTVNDAAEGPLRVLLNGHLLYERPVRERSPAPIILPIDYLVDGENHVVIQTEDTGFAFWKSNTYYLQGVLITADVVDDRGAVASQTFSIPDSEMGAFESAQLQFVPECDQRKAQRLVVQLNSRIALIGPNQTREVPNVLYSGLPDCGVMFKTDVAKEHLRIGENRVLFASEGGSYVVDRAKIVIRLKQSDYPIYYFNLQRDMYDALDAGHGQLRMTITFTDYRNTKTGEIVVNGFVQSFATNEYAYQAVLDPGVLTPGPNTIQIAPHVDKLDVAELKIELV